MVLDSLFKIENVSAQDGAVTASLQIDRTHDVFNGHFPGQPVVPGVCMMQLVTEILEKTTNRSLRIRLADNIKFLAVMDPTLHHAFRADVSWKSVGDTIIASATLLAENVTFFKLKAELISDEH